MLRIAICLCLLALPAVAQQYDLLFKGATSSTLRTTSTPSWTSPSPRAKSPPSPRTSRPLRAAASSAPASSTCTSTSTPEPAFGALTGDSSVYPDGFSFRTGVTTMVDAGTAGWRNFADFRQRVIDRARTRVLAFINIVGHGMSPAGEDDPAEMQPEEAAKVARAHADIVVGYKTAHYGGPGWVSIDKTVEAGKLTNQPVMVDFGTLTKERNLRRCS
jgi:hypothetical protein